MANVKKRLCLRSTKQNKSSFSERICDDLCEVILQFLPFEDKFRFECVSKQFKRTVHAKHYRLIIGGNMPNKDLQLFESILEKLSNIKSLRFERSRLPDNTIIGSIIRICNCLTEFYTDFSQISEEVLQSFVEKYGSQLSSVREMVSKKNSNQFFDKINSRRMEKLSLLMEVDFFRQPLAQNFKTFINNNNKNITHLELIFDSLIGQSIEPTVKIISQLNKLTSLRLAGNVDFNSLTQNLEHLSRNCSKLKALSLEFDNIPKIRIAKSDSESESDSDSESEYESDFECESELNFMSELKKFKQLKRLVFKFELYSGLGSEINDYFLDSLKSGLENITHLSIEFEDYIFDDMFIVKIVDNLPNLHNLSIDNYCRVTERTAHIVANLSKLEFLKLYSTDSSTINSFKKIVVQSCRKIKSIEIIK